MSRRYGRNQKRAHRAALAAAEAKAMVAMRTVTAVSVELEALREMARELECIAPFSAARAPRVIAAQGQTPPDQIVMEEREFDGPLIYEAEVPTVRKVRRMLDRFRSRVDLDPITAAIHVRVALGEHNVAYYLSAQALVYAKVKEQLMGTVARQMIDKLAEVTHATRR